MPFRLLFVAAFAAIATVAASPLAAQEPLTLSEALERADRQAYANRAASATTDAESARALAPLQGILPTVRLEGGYARTTDPIGAFGTTLRQRAITAQDFDPRRLNHPDAAENWAAAVVVEQPIFNADAHLGRQAAKRAAEASRAKEEWTRGSTRLDVVKAYYGAVLAAERVGALEAAARAAHEHVRQARAMVEKGLVTPSDALLAEVKAGEVDAQLIAARGEAELAVRGLAVLLGAPEDSALALPSRLPSVDGTALLDGTDATDDVLERGDVRAAKHGLEAARADARRAKSLHLPRVNAFARYDWNSPDRPFEGEENWTAGVMATWTPFAGGSTIAERRETAARERAAKAMAEGAEANARLEAAQSENALRVAVARLEIADRAARQSAEAHRIVARKYEGGLATVVELLDASAVDTQSQLGRVHAQYTVITAAAEFLHTRGRDVSGIEEIITAPQTTEDGNR
jgi:outer membrane protein TolC